MKRLASIVIAVLLVFCVFDQILDCLCNYKLDCINSSKYKECYALVNTPSPDILVLGASNASHNFNSNIISDSLGLSVYNAAQDGQGMLYNKAIFDAIVAKHKPKYIILGLYYALLNGSFDQSIMQYSYLYGRSPEMTDEINELIKPWERLRYWSAAYRFNSNFMWILSVDKNDTSKDSLNGFVPLPHGDGIIELEDVAIDFKWGEKSHAALVHILKTCRDHDIQCVVCLTPQYRNNKSLVFNREMESCSKQYGAVFIDFTNVPYYNSHPELFKDVMHLNSKGADIFTHHFLGKLVNSTNQL